MKPNVCAMKVTIEPKKMNAFRATNSLYVVKMNTGLNLVMHASSSVPAAKRRLEQLSVKRGFRPKLNDH